MNGLELVSFQLISNAGMAKSSFMEAIQKAQNNEFEQADTLLEQGKEQLIQAHGAHAGLIQKEAAGEPTTPTLLLVHAEDQLMSAEVSEMMAKIIVDQARRISALEQASAR